VASMILKNVMIDASMKINAIVTTAVTTIVGEPVTARIMTTDTTHRRARETGNLHP